jgi:hypothetical protein
VHFYAKQPINYGRLCGTVSHTIIPDKSRQHNCSSKARDKLFMCVCIMRLYIWARKAKCCFNRRRTSFTSTLFLHSAGAKIAMRCTKLCHVLPHFSSPNCYLGCNLSRIALNGEKFVANGAKNKGLGNQSSHSKIVTKHLKCQKVLYLNCARYSCCQVRQVCHKQSDFYRNSKLLFQIIWKDEFIFVSFHYSRSTPEGGDYQSTSH